MIFKPIYKIYTKTFYKNIIDQTQIKTVFQKFGNTAVYEKYILNAAQFSAAKNLAETKLLQEKVFDGEGTIKSYSEFRRDAKEITDIQNDTWLRTEWESQRSILTSISEWDDMMSNADLYPYWVYRGVMDSREREEHVELEDKVFRIGDADGDSCFPPNGDNCRCDGEPVDDQYLQENNTRPSEGKDMLQHVDERFRFNGSQQGTLPNKGSYFDVLPSANKSNGKLYSGESTSTLNTNILAAKGMHAMLEIRAEWEKEFHVDKLNNLIFQNKELYTNVVFSDNSLHAIVDHSKGFEELPAAVINPDQVWGFWEDESTQQIVLRNYIKGQYVVFTRQGIITDAYLVAKNSISRFQKGVILNP